MKRCYRIHESDSVAVACESLAIGDTVQVGGKSLTLKEPIPEGHKVALCDLSVGDPILKYGFPIGKAKAAISAGDHVHCHNVASSLAEGEAYDYHPSLIELPKLPAKTFRGFRRPNGRIGIRNEIWIIPTVGCVNGVAKAIAAASQGFVTGSIDNVVAYSHPYGCSQLGEDQHNTQKLLCGLIHHPNAAGVLVLSLGCENNHLGEMKKVLGAYDSDRVKFLVCQESEDEIADGVALVRTLCEAAASLTREECDVSELVIGLKCGGSDGFSGITANALVGHLSDRLIAMGGSSLLTEVPEMFGAESLLMSRCRDHAVFERAVRLIEDFKAYFRAHGEPIDENPSPGNKAGGISTLAEKSLGCTQKGGCAPIEDVLLYGESIRSRGLSLLQAPGNDLVASCALAAAGAHLILFTTGRGTPFGCPVPTLKIASNSALATHKSAWIDYDAGVLLSGTSAEEATDVLLSLILRVTEGERAKSERLDKSDLSIFKSGVTL